MAEELKDAGSNNYYKGEWTASGAYRMVYFDGMVENFIPQRCHSAIIGTDCQALRYGVEVKINRLHAISAKEFPLLKARQEEGRRRFREFRDHCYSGADTWIIPKRGAGPRVTQADIEEALTRAFPQWDGSKVFEKKLEETKGDKTPELALLDNIRYWLQTKQVATAWAEIQAERKAKATESFLDVGDDIARLMAE